MKKFIFAAALPFMFAPSALAGPNTNTHPGYGTPQYSGSSHYAPVAPRYMHGDYAAASYEDEIIVYEERSRRKQSYYFKPRDYRSFKCRTRRNGVQKCSFDFHGDNADDVEYYLAQALIYATGNTDNQAYCSHTRRATSVTCSVRGDLRGMNTDRLRYALYGR